MSDISVSVRLDELHLSFSGSESFFRRHVDELLQGALLQAAGRKGVAVELPPVGRRAQGQEREEESGGAAIDGAEEEGGVLVDVVPEEERTLPPVDGFQPQSAHFAQFIRQVGDRAAQPDQQIMAFGFFLWNYEKQEAFTPEHLVGCFRTLGLPVPEELDERLSVLVARKRFLQPARDEGSYRLSNKGVNYVKNRLLAGD
jgi:hypothetical protein